MKSDLMLSKFQTANVSGVFNLIEQKTYFGSKIIKLEDYVSIENQKIQYSEIFNDTNFLYNGYQYFDYQSYRGEKLYLKKLTDIKKKYTTIELITKDTVYKNNTEWELTIDYTSILREYLFLKLKQNRIFKCVRPQDLLNKNINESIYSYIDFNLIDRFNFDKLVLYIQYYNIDNNNSYHYDPYLMFNPQYNEKINIDTNVVNSVNLSYRNNNIVVLYNQNKNYEAYKFDYYFDIYYKRT
jgi:hypothetical protein